MRPLTTRRTHIFVVILFTAVLTVALPLVFAHADSATTTTQTSNGFWGDVMNVLGGALNVAFWPFKMLLGVVFSIIAELLVDFARIILVLADTIFNWLVFYTIIQFSTIYSSIQAGVETAWTAFRDIANILIIGLLTFIAISMILDIKEFGQKKLVARVLIVAILINFSLLFTKMAIDASNYTATMIYRAAALGPSDSLTNTGAAAIPSIGDRFMDLTGIQSIAGDTLKNSAEVLWYQGLVQEIIYATSNFLLVSGAATILLYGSFLLLARALMIIFLFITAAIAFTTLLLPKLQTSSTFGWNAWLRSLLQVSVLAPIMMILLWATLRVGTDLMSSPAFSAGRSKAGAFIIDPTTAGGANWLIGYLIILGLLYGAFRISSSFAGAAGKINFTGGLSSLGLSALGNATGFLGRQTVGRYAANLGGKLEKSARTANADTAGGRFAQRLYDFGARQAKGIAKRDFNVLQGSLGKAIAKSSGTTADKLFGKSKGGFSGRQGEYMKKEAEFARRVALTDKDKEEIAKKGIEQVRKENPDMDRRYKEAEQAHEDARATQEVIKRDAEKRKSEIGAAMSKQLTELTKAREAARTGDAAARDRMAELTQSVEAHKANMNEQEQRIKEATQATTDIKRNFDQIRETTHQAAVDAGYIPEKFNTAADVAEKHVGNSLTALLHATGVGKGSRAALAKDTASMVGKQEKTKKRRESFEDFRAVLKEDEESSGHGTPTGGTPAH